jgi:hypothetical protein
VCCAVLVPQSTVVFGGEARGAGAGTPMTLGHKDLRRAWTGRARLGAGNLRRPELGMGSPRQDHGQQRWAQEKGTKVRRPRPRTRLGGFGTRQPALLPGRIGIVAYSSGGLGLIIQT